MEKIVKIDPLEFSNELAFILQCGRNCMKSLDYLQAKRKPNKKEYYKENSITLQRIYLWYVRKYKREIRVT